MTWSHTGFRASLNDAMPWHESVSKVTTLPPYENGDWPLLLGSWYSREGAVVAGGHRDGGEVIALEAHHAQLVADAPPQVQGAIERIVIEDPIM